jgi:gliding motility-associated protein GldM
MALPREPRQKMINMMYLVLTALLALNVSSEILNAFKTVNNSLQTTNATIDKSTERIMASLKEKMEEPATAEKAKIWYPKAAMVQNAAKTIYSYIQKLKDDILIKAGGDPNNDEKHYKEDNLDIATRMMVDKGGGQELLHQLSDFKKSILGVDPAVDSAFATNLPIDLTIPKTQNKSNKTWEAVYFHMVPTVAALTILSKFQNDVKTSENRVIAFCHNKVGEVVVRFDTYAAIVGQNSTYLMPGQELEITAGVGAFSKAATPVITIGGQTVNIGSEGTALQKIAGGGIGNHSVPVKITYTDQDGHAQVIEKLVEYTVGQANASIALDKMNVLYVGVNNPVSIAASGGGDDKVQVTIVGGGGSLTKIGAGKYVARVNSVTDDCKISVSVDGRLAGISQFRVRTIPNAVATVGGVPSGDNVSAGAFKAQSGVGAYIKDFPFELRYTVTSFTLTADDDNGDIIEAPCQGNTWSTQAQTLLRNLKAGNTVTIDNIRCVGEDGRNVKIPSIIYYIK